jgi:micrococcal nuclease
MLREMLLASALLALSAPGTDTPPVLGGRVTYVVDGDTIHVQLGGRIEKVRYIGVNAPESAAGNRATGGRQHHLSIFPHTPAAGDAARRINLDLVGSRSVRLELDRRRRDEHHRLLAYVWVGDTMINAEMVKRGYAQVMSVPPDFRHRALFVRLQAEARAAGRGLWQAAPPLTVPEWRRPRRSRPDPAQRGRVLKKRPRAGRGGPLRSAIPVG